MPNVGGNFFFEKYIGIRKALSLWCGVYFLKIKRIENTFLSDFLIFLNLYFLLYPAIRSTACFWVAGVSVLARFYIKMLLQFSFNRTGNRNGNR